MPSPADLRDAVHGLTVIATRDLNHLWRDIADAVHARRTLEAVLPGLLDEYGTAAAVFAADWYDELRDEKQARGRFTATPPPVDPVTLGVAELARWAVTPLTTDGTQADVLERASGGLQRRIANLARDTITTASVADPAARGWQREAAYPGACPFCRMLEGRGAVYTRGSVDFGAHDHCRCIAVPAFDGHPAPVKPYTPTGRDITDADRALTRAWITANL